MRIDSFNLFFKKIDKTSKLQKELLKTQFNHDEVYEDTWRDKENEWLDYFRNDGLRLLSHMLVIVKLWKKLQDLD